MPIEQAADCLRILSTDMKAHPQPDFERISSWWDRLELVGTLVEDDVTGYGIEMDALARVRQAPSEAANETASERGARARAETIRTPVVALQHLLERRMRTTGEAASRSR